MTGFSPRPECPQGVKVLLLDTNPSSCRVIEAQLKECGYSATTTTSVPEALAQLTAPQDYEVLFIELTAIEEKGPLLPQLKEVAKYVPLVLFSEGAPVQHVLASLNLGAAEYLEKPLSAAKLQTLWQHSARKVLGSPALVGDLDDIKKPLSPEEPGTPSPAHSYSPASHVLKTDMDSELDRSSSALLDDSPAQSPTATPAPTSRSQESRRRKADDFADTARAAARPKLQGQCAADTAAAASSCANPTMPSFPIKMPDMSQMMATLPQGMKECMSMGFTGFKDFTTFLNSVAPYLPPPPPGWQAPPPLPPGMSWGLPAMPPPFMLPFLFSNMGNMGGIASPGFPFMFGGPNAGAAAAAGLPAAMMPPFPAMAANGMCAAQFMLGAGAMPPGMPCMPPFSGVPGMMLQPAPLPAAPAQATATGVPDMSTGTPVNTATVSDAMAAAGFAMPACAASNASEDKISPVIKQQSFSGDAMSDSPLAPLMTKAGSMEPPSSADSNQTDITGLGMDVLGLPRVPSEANLFGADEMLFTDWLLEDDGMVATGDDMFHSLRKNSSLADLINDSLFTTLSAMG